MRCRRDVREVGLILEKALLADMRHIRQLIKGPLGGQTCFGMRKIRLSLH